MTPSMTACRRAPSPPVSADLILPVAEIPEAILRFDRTEPRLPLPEDGEDVPQDERLFCRRYSRNYARAPTATSAAISALPFCGALPGVCS